MGVDEPPRSRRFDLSRHEDAGLSTGSRPEWNAAPKDSLTWPFRSLVERDDITARLGEILCPAVIFHGDADQSISMEAAERLRAGLKGCERLVVVQGAAHASNLSHTEQVNGPLRDFLLSHA